MKKLLIAALFLIPSLASAAPFVKDSFIATDTTATSTFAGDFRVDGNVSLFAGGYGGGIPIFTTSLLAGAVAVFSDFQLPNGLGTIHFRDTANTTDWAIIDGSGLNEVTLLRGDMGAGVVLNLNEISGGSGNPIFTFPDYSGTFGLLEATQTWTGDNTFSKGASATTTVNFGEIGDATSHSCFNTKNTDGQDISFYFVGTAMVVENNACQ